MAINWKPGEAVEAIKNGDGAAISDIGKRFPNFTVAAAMALAGSPDGFLRILEALPERVTVRVIESVMKGDATDEDGDSDGGEEKVKDKPAKEPKLTKAGLMKKTPKELVTLAKAAEIEIMSTKKFKAMDDDEKKETLVAAILKAQAAASEVDEDEKPAKKDKPKQKEDDGWGDDEEDEKPAKKDKKAKDDDDWDI